MISPSLPRIFCNMTFDMPFLLIVILLFYRQPYSRKFEIILGGFLFDVKFKRSTDGMDILDG
jgi:hypothetical protein